MKKIISTILAVAAAATLFTSCGKDDSKTDVREQAVGTYVVAMQTYVQQENGELVLATDDEGLGFDLDAFVIKKGSSDDKIEIRDSEGELILIGSNVKEAANGFVFDIDEQTQDDVTFTGFPYFNLSGTMYDAFFDKAEKTFSFSIIGESDETIFVTVFAGTKVE